MREFKEPDLKGPRFRKSGHSLISDNNKSLFRAFVKKYPEYKNMDTKMFKQIMEHHLSLLARHIAENRDGIELGDQIGAIFLGGMRIKSSKVKAINFGKSRKYGKTIRGGNLNQDGLTAKIYFTTQNSKYRMRGRQIWTFKASRNLKKMCSKNFETNWDKYIVLDNLKKIRSVFERDLIKRRMRQREEKEKQFYNDFDI